MCGEREFMALSEGLLATSQTTRDQADFSYAILGSPTPIIPEIITTTCRHLLTLLFPKRLNKRHLYTPVFFV